MGQLRRLRRSDGRPPNLLSGARRARVPALAGLAIDVLEGEAVVVDADEREGHRQTEATRTDRAGIEDREPVGGGNERHMGVPADDEIGVRPLGQRAHGLEDARAVDAHVEQEDPQALAPAAAEGQDEGVGEIGAGRIDVTAHDVKGGREWREQRENVEVADVAGMQDGPGRGRADEREGGRMRASVGVGHDGKRQRPGGRELEDAVDPSFGRTHGGELERVWCGAQVVLGDGAGWIGSVTKLLPVPTLLGVSSRSMLDSRMPVLGRSARVAALRPPRAGEIMRFNRARLVLATLAVAGLYPACVSGGTAGNVADSEATDATSQPELGSEATAESEASTPEVVTADVAAPDGSAPDNHCGTADDCVFSYFGSLVQRTEDCYCLGCPGYPVTVTVNLALGNAWQEHCTDWAVTAGCQEIDCGNPGQPTCTLGECVGSPGSP